MRHSFSFFRQNKTEFESEIKRKYPSFSCIKTQKESYNAKERFFLWFKKIQSYFARKEAEVLCRVMRAQDAGKQEGMHNHLLNAKYSFQRFIFHRPQMKLVATLLLAVIVTSVFLYGGSSQGATYIFSQSSWAGGATANSAQHPGDQTGWNEYSAKDAEIAVVNGGADLQLALPAVQSVQENTDAEFNGTQTGDGFYMDGTGKLYLKKPETAACTAPEQCASGTCTGNVCM